MLAAEKRIGSKLLVPSSVKKLVQLDGRQANNTQQMQQNAGAESALFVLLVLRSLCLLVGAPVFLQTSALR